MTIVFIILFCILILFLLYLIISSVRSKLILKRKFSSNNVIVFGKKGKGKDLLFQQVINSRKKEYYSNISYGGKFNKACANDLELAGNTYENFIKGKVLTLDVKNYPYEEKDFYFSDVGIHLPSQYDSFLHKTYKGFPISYALSRHLWSNNIHCNAQNLERIWKALREQADTYIKCCGVSRSFFIGYLKLEFIIYDKYASAKNELCPVSNRVWNSYSKAERDIYNATNGYIEKRFMYVRIKSIAYDTRAYYEILFGKKFEKLPRKINLKKFFCKKKRV